MRCVPDLGMMKVNKLLDGSFLLIGQELRVMAMLESGGSDRLQRVKTVKKCHYAWRH